MADSKKYDGSQWEHSLRKLTTATEAVENPLYSDGTAITSYTIKGNTVQDGTPTPSNPVDVNGVGVRTENLLNNNPATQGDGYVDNAILNQDGTLTASTPFWVTEYIPVTEGTYYYYNNLNRVSFSYINFYDSSKTNIGSVLQKPAMSPEGLNFTELAVPTDTAFIRMTIDKNSTYNCLYDRQLSIYIPYGYKIPISSGGVTTNIYLGSTQTVRQIKKLVLDGTENWQGSDTSPTKNLTLEGYAKISGISCVSTHYNPANNVDSGDPIPYDSCCFYIGASNVVYLKGNESSSYPKTIADFKAYLAQQYANGTPVTVWYVLATPQTAAVNEPLMKIGTYADTLSNATAIPTTEGANSITVDTTVQPSEFTATWTGWHNSSVKEWDGSDWN